MGGKRSQIHYSASSKKSRKDEWNPSPSDGVGDHKGIGMILLEKMGYKGGGLGKNQQGITVPIEVTMRPKNLGLGHQDFKEATVLPTFSSTIEPKCPTLGGRSNEKPWLKNDSKKKVYVTAAHEWLPQQRGQCFKVVQEVIDMRGPQVRVLTNLHNLNAEDKAGKQDVPMPELQYNAILMVDLATVDVQKLERDLRNLRETVVELQDQIEKLQTEANYQEVQLKNMREIQSALDQIAEESSSGTLTLENLAASFGDLWTRFPDDYKVSDLSCIACSYALPLFMRMIQGWDPLQNPTRGIEEVSLWKQLLQGNESGKLYVQLLMEVVFPAVRISGTNSWHVQDPVPMLRFLEIWEELLPSPVLQTILTNIVMPKITAAVNSWDPCIETIPIHSWIHPWLPMLQNKLEHCYDTIRTRLVSLLHAWHPSDDNSVYNMLSPWRNVFDSASWEQLMVRYIMPKVLGVMQRELQVNPTNQNLDQFHWVRTWANAIPTHHMLQLMDIFFDKWQEVLYHWLCKKPKFEEVRKWFLGWKHVLPPDLLANEHVQCRLSVGLNMINQAVGGMEVTLPGLKENIINLKVHEHRQYEARKNTPTQAEELGGGAEMSLKEVVESHAQQYSLVFKPKPGRMHDGHQIYGFGNISITIDSLNEKVLARTGDKSWNLVSLEQLLKFQNLSKKKR